MTREKYKEIQRRVKNAERIIKNHGGFLKVPKSWIDKYQKMVEEMLIYEIEHDLLPPLLR